MAERTCSQCGRTGFICPTCGHCDFHCACGHPAFDADELGLDPETDNTPEDDSRHA